ncbi:outer membrane protein [Vibrio rumoiensis]|uniref:outer membrane protein n=1 Tax=Vibrio rumoiensis TaxID=76258 RepID=UPI003AA99589
MKGSKALFAAAALFSSTTCYAQADNFVRQTGDQFYIGADLAFSNTIKLDVDDVSGDDHSDMGYNIVAGYEFSTHDVVKTSIEAEYRKFGDADFSDSGNYLNIDSHAYFINFKAHLFVLDDFGNFYLAPMIGVGQMSIDSKSSILQLNVDKDRFAYQVGAELGIRFRKNFDVHLGYRSMYSQFTVSDSDVDINMRDIYAGVRYFF